MPVRRIPIVKNEFYHVFNKSVASQPIFLTNKDYQRALNVLSYYIYDKPMIRFSHYNRLPTGLKTTFLNDLRKNPKQIQLLAFCLMPNHIHFLIREIKDCGILRFVGNLQNSYAKYFNVRTERNGSLFQSRFKVVRIESEEQLLHICRYIHLNPLSSFILKNVTDLESYPWSSYFDYLGKRELSLVDTNEIMNYFPSVETFKNFTFDQLDYQRSLEKVKHLSLE